MSAWKNWGDYVLFTLSHLFTYCWYLIIANGLYDLLPCTPLLITWSKSPIRSYTLCFLEYSVIYILCTAKNHYFVRIITNYRVT